MRRARVLHLTPENAGTLELAEPLREGRGRDRAERVPELREARAPEVGRVQDRDGVTAFEDVREELTFHPVMSLDEVLGFALEPTRSSKRHVSV